MTELTPQEKLLALQKMGLMPRDDRDCFADYLKLAMKYSDAQKEIVVYKDLLANHDDLLDRCVKAEAKIEAAKQIVERIPKFEDWGHYDSDGNWCGSNNFSKIEKEIERLNALLIPRKEVNESQKTSEGT